LRALAARAAVRAHVARRLNLTAEQITRLKSRRSVAADAMKAIRADEGLTREQKIAQGRSLGEATRGEMRAILTPEQRAKLDAFRERLGERQRTQRSAAGTP
jgi:Spy/CpxP family protein refolding chaperone